MGRMPTSATAPRHQPALRRPTSAVTPKECPPGRSDRSASRTKGRGPSSDESPSPLTLTGSKAPLSRRSTSFEGSRISSCARQRRAVSAIPLSETITFHSRPISRPWSSLPRRQASTPPGSFGSSLSSDDLSFLRPPPPRAVPKTKREVRIHPLGPSHAPAEEEDVSLGQQILHLSRSRGPIKSSKGKKSAEGGSSREEPVKKVGNQERDNWSDESASLNEILFGNGSWKMKGPGSRGGRVRDLQELEEERERKAMEKVEEWIRRLEEEQGEEGGALLEVKREILLAKQEDEAVDVSLRSSVLKDLKVNPRGVVAKKSGTQKKEQDTKTVVLAQSQDPVRAEVDKCEDEKANDLSNLSLALSNSMVKVNPGSCDSPSSSRLGETKPVESSRQQATRMEPEEAAVTSRPESEEDPGWMQVDVGVRQEKVEASHSSEQVKHTNYDNGQSRHANYDDGQMRHASCDNNGQMGHATHVEGRTRHANYDNHKQMRHANLGERDECKEENVGLPHENPLLEYLTSEGDEHPRELIENSSVDESKSVSIHLTPIEQEDIGSTTATQNNDDIYAFLDKMEHSSTLSYLLETNQTRLSDKGAVSRNDADSRRGGNIEPGNSGGAALSQLTLLDLELKEKSAIISDLRATVEEQKELLARSTRNANQELKQKLDQQRKEHEAALKRHLAFIDQLIEEKKGLSDRCEQLLGDLKEAERCHRSNMAAIEERHAVELKRMRAMTSSAEKIKRDRWIDEKTQEIKTLTVRGLEPEIQRLLAQHQSEVESIRSAHVDQLNALQKEWEGRLDRELEDLRLRLTKEKEESCLVERELARQRVERQFEEEEKILQERRVKLLQQIEEEREHWERQMHQWRSESLAHKEEQRASHLAEIERMKAERLAAEEELRTEHARETAALREKWSQEKKLLAHEEGKARDELLRQQEVRLREEWNREREEWAAGMEAQHAERMAALRTKIEEEGQQALSRLREKLQTELESLESSEQKAQSKMLSLKSELATAMEERVHLTSLLRQREKETEQLREDLNRLRDERRDLSAVLRKEFQQHLQHLESENRILKADALAAKTSEERERRRCEEEVETLKRKAEEERKALEGRVRQTMMKKEEEMTTLRREYHDVLLRNQQLSSTLESLREEIRNPRPHRVTPIRRGI